MSGVLTTSSNVSCGHGGSVSTNSAAKLTVSGSAVLLKTGIANQAVSGCQTPIVTTAPTSNKCLLVTSVDSGEATKLTAGGKPVVLDTLTGETNGIVAGVTPQLLLSGTAGQTKLTAN